VWYERRQDMKRAHGQLVDLFLEMKDRHGLLEPTADTLQAERGELEAHGPLVLVGMLRASLVSLRDFKQSTERDFGRVRDRQKAAEVCTSQLRPLGAFFQRSAMTGRVPLPPVGGCAATALLDPNPSGVQGFKTTHGWTAHQGRAARRVG
jgi:hypothetical protein